MPAIYFLKEIYIFCLVLALPSLSSRGKNKLLPRSICLYALETHLQRVKSAFSVKRAVKRTSFALQIGSFRWTSFYRREIFKRWNSEFFRVEKDETDG